MKVLLCVMLMKCQTMIFISHMVQMKVIIYLNLGRLETPLYPTWFRWKYKNYKYFHPKFILYIPHGSDERDLISTTYPCVTGFISHMVQMKAFFFSCIHLYIYILYIPHGSDESTPALRQTIVNACFISHMVQMKVRTHRIHLSDFNTLYPTWFRWKL